MKIGIVVRGFHSHGGISSCAFELANRLSLDNEVHIFTNVFESENKKLIYHRIRPLSIKGRYKTAINFASFALNSFREIKNHNFDIVHTHSSACFVQDIVTAHSCHKASMVKLIDKNNGNYKKELMKKYLNSFNIVNLAIEKIQYQKGNYKKIIAISSAIKYELIDYYGVKEKDIVVIPNGVDLDRFKKDTLIRSKVRRSIGIENTDIVVLFVSHRFENKGIDILIDSISRINCPILKLVVVSGDDSTKYMKLAERLNIRKQIHFVGATKCPEKYYKASDLFVLPSHYEGFALVRLEAMAVGLPVITTDTGGASDFIENRKEGYLVSTPPIVEEITKLLSELVYNGSIRSRVGNNARKKANCYSWENIAKNTIELYKNIL